MNVVWNFAASLAGMKTEVDQGYWTRFVGQDEFKELRLIEAVDETGHSLFLGQADGKMDSRCQVHYRQLALWGSRLGTPKHPHRRGACDYGGARC
jgi:hypothetical protein